MTVGEFLKKGRRHEFELRELKEARLKALANACSVTARTDREGVHSSAGNATENKLITYADYSAEIEKRMKELAEYRAEMLALINTIENSVCRAIFIARYINCKTWDCIADEMNYTVRNILILHKKTLKEMHL